MSKKTFLLNFCKAGNRIGKIKNNKLKMMKIKILFLLLLIFCTSTMGAQQMEMVKKPLDAPDFYQNGKKYKMGELVLLMKPNYEAVDYMKKARTNYTFSQIFAFTGAGLVGYPIGTSLGGGDPQWAIAIAGGGIMALSIPFLVATNKNSTKAVESYNKGFGKSKNTAFIQSVKLVYTVNGFSLALQF